MRSNKHKVTLVHLPNGKHAPVNHAFNVAISLHQAGKIRRAAELYRRIIAKVPRHADALHLLGITKRQQGDINEAVKLIKSAIKINPGASMYYSNLSEAYRTIGKFAEAGSACIQALKLDPGLPEVHFNMGAIAFAQEHYDSAIASYKKALSLKQGYIDALLGLGDSLVKSGQIENGRKYYEEMLAYQPESVTALTRIGIALRMMDRIDEAIEHYKKSISRLPAEPDLYYNLALLHQRKGNNKEAAECLRKLLELTPDDEAARHILNALDGSTTASAPPEYVRDMFDNYAETFETHLVQKLDYRVPEILAGQIKTCLGERTELKALDLGCGTGLMGEGMKDYCVCMTGIDLSPKMIEQARLKNIYSELVVADILEFMQASAIASYDIVVATDVFVYIGDLENIFAEAIRLLTPGGLFAFSVETNSEADADFVLSDTGRYYQSASYLDRLRMQFGFSQVHYSHVRLRNQHEHPVYGYLCVYRAPV